MYLLCPSELGDFRPTWLGDGHLVVTGGWWRLSWPLLSVDLVTLISGFLADPSAGLGGSIFLKVVSGSLALACGTMVDAARVMGAMVSSVLLKVTECFCVSEVLLWLKTSGLFSPNRAMPGLGHNNISFGLFRLHFVHYTRTNLHYTTVSSSDWSRVPIFHITALGLSVLLFHFWHHSACRALFLLAKHKQI